MVESKTRKVAYFVAFLLPCLLLYILFFITPFFRGIAISLTNWDGLTPKSPISISQETFENDILGKLKKESDKEYLLSVYEFNEADKTYSRLSVKGFTRNKIERIIKKTKYEPENNKFVGLENYKKIFTGQVKEDFYPRWYEERKYNKTSSLKNSIPKKEFKKEILAKANDEQTILFMSHYQFNKERDAYILKSEYDEFDIEELIWSLPEVVSTKTLSENKVDEYTANIREISLTQNEEQKVNAFNSFISENNLSETSVGTVKESTNRMFELGKLKNELASVWVLRKFNMGVIGFTIFFAFFSVIGINLVAFLLALALDTKMRGQSIYRSIFFLPNVLSMVIVALIWSMLFVQLLPALTGIDRWITDSSKTPWLLVLVATWQGAGYYMIVYLAGLQSIPTDVIEAAKIDGASTWQRFKMITLPLLLPAMTISLFLSIANALKSFDLIYAMIGSTGYATGTVPFVMDIYFDAFAQKQAGLATAKAMILFIVIFIITGIQLFVMKRKEIEQ